MPGTAIGRAVDYLVTQITALPAAAQAVVSDGFPASRADLMVSVGVTNEDGGSEFEINWAGLGAGREDELFSIPVLIEAYAGGGPEVMSTVRLNAVAVLDAVNGLIRTDRTLGGALTSPGVAQVRNIRLVQTNTPEEAGEGRYARIYLDVVCTSRF